MEETKQQDILEIRTNIRARELKERDALAPELRHERSSMITQRLRSYLLEKYCHSIHCYISFRSEVQTREFIENAIREGTHITVPTVERTGDINALAHTEIS